MSFQKAKLLIRQNRIFYLMGFLLILGLKFYYSRAGSEELRWILAPTAWWVSVLGRIPFEYVPQVGYINHPFRFIIAPSCSGVQFLIISAATLIFSFVHRMRTRHMGFVWIAFSISISCLFTIFINGFRIVLSIYLPLLIYKSGESIGWMTPKQLHTIIGTAVYFTSLFAIYHAAGWISIRLNSITESISEKSVRKTVGRWLMPIFWYFFIVLGIPILNGAWQHNGRKFMEYAFLMVGICMAIMFLSFVIMIVYKKLYRGGKKHLPTHQ